MKNWFTVEAVDRNTYSISEYRHWEETHCYLLIGSQRSLLIDTGLGICDISQEIRQLTEGPVTAVATHIHWDHIGGHKYYPDFYAQKEELPWLQGEFPQPREAILRMVADRCDFPAGYDLNTYEFFQGTPTRLLEDGDVIDLGDRQITVFHTPGHSPGHLCFWDAAQSWLFTGDLVYKDVLFAWFPSTDPAAYLRSLEKIATLPVKRVFPGHHSLNISPDLPREMRDALRALDAKGMLCHGTGQLDYGSWGIWL